MHSNGLVIFRIRKCVPASGLCIFANRLIMQTEKTGDFIFTESMPFDEDYIYFLEIYVLTQNNIDKNFLRVDQIDNFPDPVLLKKENSIFERVRFDLRRKDLSQEVHEIKINPMIENFEFQINFDGMITEPIKIKESSKSIISKLEKLTKTECEDVGKIEKFEYFDFEHFKKSTGETEPFCGRKSLKITNSHKFKLKNVALEKSTLCFAYKGRIQNQLQIDVLYGGKQLRTSNIKIQQIEPGKRQVKWKFECFEISNFINIESPSGFIDSITLFSDGGDLFVDELLIGKTEGFFQRVQSKIGVRPGGNFIIQA